MNKKQWSVLGIGLFLLGILFAISSVRATHSCLKFALEGGTSMNIFCVRGQIFAPFPYIFFGLGLIFSILSRLEPNKK